MAMGTRKQREKQAGLWIAQHEDFALAQNKPTTASNILGLGDKWNAAY
jgi:hypothetical protein